MIRTGKEISIPFSVFNCVPFHEKSKNHGKLDKLRTEGYNITYDYKYCPHFQVNHLFKFSCNWGAQSPLRLESAVCVTSGDIQIP